jgi:outer membrane protein TolC
MEYRAGIAALLSCLLASPAGAQSPRTPSVSYETGVRGVYKPSSVSGTDFRDTARLHDLIRAGQMYLSLQDAIALALENNLDLELQRFGIRMAETDTLRAKGGGLLRGVGLTVNETPAGVGGPGSALNNSAATGVTPSTSVPTNVTDTQLIQEAQNNLGIVGTFPFATGPLIPQFDPAITGQFLAQHLTTPQTNLVVSGTPSLNTNTTTGNAGYAQGFSPGTFVVAGFQNLRTDSNSTRNLINPFYTSSFGVTLTQPLLRGFGPSVNRRFIRIAKNGEKITDYIFQQQVISTVSGVIRLYTDLVSLNEDFHVKQQNLSTAERLAEDNRNKVEQGTLAPIELTRAQAQVAAARQDLINSEGFVLQQELIFKNVLTRDLKSDPLVHAARIIPTDTLSIDPLPAQTTEELIRLALENRPEMQAAKLQVENSEISLKGGRNGILPQLDIVANASNSGLAGSPNPAFTGALPTGQLLGYGDGYGSALEQILRRDYPTYSVGINLTLPLRNRIAQADLARDELQLRQTRVRGQQLENQIRVEVEDALIALRRTRAAYDAALETRKLQEQSLEIEQERFNVGLSTNFLVIQYETNAAQARSTEVIARGAYAKARNQLERATGQTLSNHNVSIDEALKGQIARTSAPQIK